RGRGSVELEYLPQLHARARPGVGVRVEDVTGLDRAPATIPYLAVAGPNTTFTFLLRAQYRIQEDRSGFHLDLSTQF
ncbi:MAG: hypothetical protein ACNA8W_11065, partial [Bradymonadaceae bacterium]